MADLTGQLLGAYRIESRLGSGGMGDVYRAVHVRLGRRAAVKVLRANEAADATFQARFLREARAAAALSHPNIVEVFDFGEQEGVSYLVMELVPDGSLRTLLKQRASGAGWSLGLGVDLVRQAATGLAYAHTHGMVHRDIKPDNLLLQRLGAKAGQSDDGSERYLLKISDFGLARLIEDDSELTVTGMVMGTPTYMSPEQCQGQPLDGRSDLYSLGVVLYEVATGAPPFRVKSLSEAVFKHISAPPVPPRQVRPDLPIALEDAIMTCLEKRPEDRYATGTELADALEGALGDTELRTIITTRGGATGGISGGSSGGRSSGASTPTASTPATPAPAAPDDPTAPTISASHPAARPPQPAARAATPAPPAIVEGEDAADGATIRASISPTPRPRPAAVRPLERSGAYPRWGRQDAENATVASTAPGGMGDSLRALLARPRALGVAGGGALVVIALIVVLVMSLGHPASAPQSVKRATPTATKAPPTVTPTPAETVTFQDALATSSGKWERDSHAFYSDGGYELAGAWYTYSPVNGWSDGSVSVSARWLSGPTDQYYGILFRGASSGQYYLFGVSQQQQWTFAEVSNGNGTPIIAARTDSHIATGAGASNTLTVQAQGSHFVFFLNGAQVGEADSSAIASGRVGLINTVGSLRVVYNNFSVAVPAP